MSPVSRAFEAHAQDAYLQNPTMTQVAAWLCLIWYLIVVTVCMIGFVQIFRHYSQGPVSWYSPNDAAAGPVINIIRPVKGMEPFLYDCLASTFRQDWVAFKLRYRFCIPSRTDPAYPVLERLVKDFGEEFNVQILVEDEDEYLQSESGKREVGPNPKIRNMSRAYREIPEAGPPNLVWIIDCNIWVGKGVMEQMVNAAYKAKFAHQLPITVDTTGGTFAHASRSNIKRTWWSTGGARIEEVALSTAHAKFYVAINTVAVAPCVMGKSTMFQKEYLDALTNDKGIDYFSHNICEDHLIGDLLWKHTVPRELEHEKEYGRKLGKHHLVHGSLAIQPIADMSVQDYWAKKVRWLRVRKFTVFLASFVEPGTESFFCSAYGAFAITTLAPFHTYLGIPQTWTAFGFVWLLSVSIWCFMDWMLFTKLQSGSTVLTKYADHVPEFAKPRDGKKRYFREWALAWLGREILALPIWLWAFYGGMTVEWRGRKFRIGFDTKVHEIEGSNATKATAVSDNVHVDTSKRKAR